ncbi:MAG: cysteine desulfurase family protein [bacterium]|nr:cysteine desulfurase family protein [bacterium]
MLELPTEVAYLDNAASTPLCPEAAEAMVPMQRQIYANPTGAHRMARDTRRRIDDARDVMAEALGCEPDEVVFTAGGTESDNLAILGHHSHLAGSFPLAASFSQAGSFSQASSQPVGIVCSAIEHPAVLEPVQRLGGQVVGVTAEGVVDMDHLAEIMEAAESQADGQATGHVDEHAGRHAGDSAAANSLGSAGIGLVSVMLANNETGMVQPVAQVAEVVRRANPQAVLHSDAVQALPWLDVATLAADMDLVSVSAHKFGGPKGVGALVVRKDVGVAPLLLGGGQERGLRSGTHNVAGIVGMAAAAEMVLKTRVQQVLRVGRLRDKLVDGLIATVPGTVETAKRAGKVAGSAHLCFEGVESEALLFLLEDAGVYASAASSCSSGAQDPSHVLAAMGYSRELAGGSLRLSLGYETTEADIDTALAAIPVAVAQLREYSDA